MPVALITGITGQDGAFLAERNSGSTMKQVCHSGVFAPALMTSNPVVMMGQTVAPVG